MAPRFYSKEWNDAVIEKTKTDKEYLKKTEKFTATYLFIVTDCPDGNDLKISLTFDKGKIVDHEYEAKPAPASFRMESEPWEPTISLVRAQGSYDTYKKLQTKELNPMQALMQKLYKSEGNMVKAMQLMSCSQAFTDLQASIDCEY